MTQTHKAYIASIVITVLGLVLVAAASPQCYFNDGSPATGYQPCNSDIQAGSYSACCSLGSAPGSNGGDVCLSSGLCFWQGASQSTGFIFADGCTDQTGKNPNCQQICTGEVFALAPVLLTFYIPYRGIADNGAGRNATTYAVLPCPDGKWCCSPTLPSGTGADCCDNSFPLALGDIIVQSSASSSVSSASSTSTSSTSPTASACPKDKSIVVGVSVGVTLGAALSAALAALVVLQRRLQYLKRVGTVQEQEDVNGKAMVGKDGGEVSTAPEIDGTQQRSELPE